jgi:Arc/MetJ family transcription regulator
MAKTSVDIDMDRLGQAKEILGTDTIRDTIDVAIREVIRRAATQNLVSLAESGAFAALLEPGAEERLWG